MKTLMLAAAAACLLAAPAQAAQIVLSAANIVGVKGDYPDPAFAASNIFDEQTGALGAEAFQDGSYWLALGVSADAYITIDLGDVYSGLSFDLFNTHNGFYFDRGTGGFEIFGSNEVATDGSNGLTLAGAKKLVGGTLAAGAAGAPPAESFASTAAGGFRYIQLRPTSVAAQRPISPRAYGLREMRVYGEVATGAVPEPATWAMMIMGFGLAGAAVRQRRLRVA